MGNIIKVLILYEKSFWKEKGFSGEGVSDCLDSPVFNVYDDSRFDDNGKEKPALVVFVNGSIARYWSKRNYIDPIL
jgi:monoamine oxidase